MKASTIFSALFAFAATQQISAAVVNVRQASATSAAPAATVAPGLTQAGVAANCNRWDLVNAGDTCQTFLTKYPEITFASLYQWNPAIGSTCNTLWQGYYVCTRVSGSAASTSAAGGPATSVATASPASTISAVPGGGSSVPAPGPTQAGVTGNCTRWDLVTSGSTCQTFINKYAGLTFALLYKWNPGVGSTCNTLWLGYYVCTAGP